VTALLYLNTVPCDDCGLPVDYLNHPWYPLWPDGQLCDRCGRARGLTGIIAALNAPEGQAGP
jgi:hypothetical protein